MSAEQKFLVRADDFVAESLDSIAATMPPGHLMEAEILRKHAAKLRMSDSVKMIRTNAS